MMTGSVCQAGPDGWFKGKWQIIFKPGAFFFWSPEIKCFIKTKLFRMGPSCSKTSVNENVLQFNLTTNRPIAQPQLQVTVVSILDSLNTLSTSIYMLRFKIYSSFPWIFLSENETSGSKTVLRLLEPSQQIIVIIAKSFLICIATLLLDSNLLWGLSALQAYLLSGLGFVPCSVL